MLAVDLPREQGGAQVSLPVCHVCGEPPIYTVTYAGNHTLRCDSKPIGSEPRHTIYVWHKTKDGAEELWAKALRQDELADLRAYKDRTEALIDRALMLAATGAKPPQAEGQAEPMLTINAEVRRRMRSVLAVLTEAKGLWRDPPQAEVKP